MAVAGLPFVRAKMLEIVGNNEIIKGTNFIKPINIKNWQFF